MFIVHAEGIVLKTGNANCDYSTLTRREICQSLDQESLGKNSLVDVQKSNHILVIVKDIYAHTFVTLNVILETIRSFLVGFTRIK